MSEPVSHICFVVNSYPNHYFPRLGIFVKRLAETFVDAGIRVTVINPQQVSIKPQLFSLPYVRHESTPGGNLITVYRPKMFGLGQQHRLGVSPVKLTTYFLTRAAATVIRRHNIKPDVFYGHFLAPSGVAVARLSRIFNVPAVCAFGESHPTIEQFGADAARRELEQLRGGIAVSSFVRDYLLAGDVIDPAKLTVIPNGFNPNLFFPRSKTEARKQLGLPEGEFIVGYVGSFDARKGVRRLEQAVDSLSGVSFIAAGQGDLAPTSPRCLLHRRVPPDELNVFLNAMDVFVLPTSREGCPNAVVEALGVGLPVISSNQSFNDEILNSACSIRVDPESIEQIAAAIAELRDDPVRRAEMADAALEKSRELHLEKRAARILGFISEVIR